MGDDAAGINGSIQLKISIPRSDPQPSDPRRKSTHKDVLSSAPVDNNTRDAAAYSDVSEPVGVKAVAGGKISLVAPEQPVPHMADERRKATRLCPFRDGSNCPYADKCR